MPFKFDNWDQLGYFMDLSVFPLHSSGNIGLGCNSYPLGEPWYHGKATIWGLTCQEFDIFLQAQ